MARKSIDFGWQTKEAPDAQRASVFDERGCEPARNDDRLGLVVGYAELAQDVHRIYTLSLVIQQ